MYVQRVIMPFDKQPNNALDVHLITKIWAKSQKSGRYPGDFLQMPEYPDLARRLDHTVSRMMRMMEMTSSLEQQLSPPVHRLTADTVMLTGYT